MLPQANQPGYESGRHHRSSGQPRDRDRERERAERHAQRAAAAAAAAITGATSSNVIQPPAAITRTGSKTGRNLSGSATPVANNSTMAIKGVSMNGGGNNTSKRSSGGAMGGLSHPYASGSQGYDPNTTVIAGEYASNNYRGSGHATPNAGYLQHPSQGLHAEDELREEKKFSLWKFLTCRCG